MDVLNTKNATILGRNMNIRKLLERKVRQHGDKPYIIFIDKDSNEEILTYSGQSYYRRSFTRETSTPVIRISTASGTAELKER